MRVCVVLALPEQQWVHDLELPDGATVREAVLQSGLLPGNPAGETDVPVGIFGRIVNGSTILKDGDRVEIYRALKADPKEVRRKKVRSRRQAANR